MGLAIFLYLQNWWPFCAYRFNDLKASNQLVQKLSVPEHTKQFVFAVEEPDSESIIYILAVQNLSECSVTDAECLIKQVRPNAVIAQINHSNVAEILSEESELNDFNGAVPTSLLGVLRRCFLDKVNTDKYENVAGNVLLREIFGTGFHGPFFAAKRAAKEHGSTFLLLESPLMKSASVEDCPSECEPVSNLNFQGFNWQVRSLVPLKSGAIVSSCLNRVVLIDDLQSRMVKSLSPFIESSAFSLSSSICDQESQNHQPSCDYKAPPFAQPVYPLLLDLHNIFMDLPSIQKALSHAQKIFHNVSRGESIDSDLLCEVYTFRIAVEGLRIALNDSARLPINEMRKPNTEKIFFSDLSMEEKPHALLAEALRIQARRFKTVVAIVDASGLAGLRRHWNTQLPLDMKDLAEQLIINEEDDDENEDEEDGEEVSEENMNKKKKQILSKKSVLAVGTAVVGVSSISKALPTVLKLATFKLPTPLKLLVTLQAKGHFTLKSAFISAQKMRTVTHTLIASGERASFSAMRAAFYQIMRKRQCVRPVGLVPWATLGCSMGACLGLFVYGDRIECAAESIPSAHSIANLGRGIQGLLRASDAAKESHGSKVHQSIESLMDRFRK